jgi:hypothetical protein
MDDRQIDIVEIGYMIIGDELQKKLYVAFIGRNGVFG